MFGLISNLIENIVVKGENAGYQHFLLFRHCFRKASSSGPVNPELLGQGLDKVKVVAI